MTGSASRPDQTGQVPVPLRHLRDFKLHLVARGCTTSGFQMLAVAVGWHVYERTGEVAYLGLIGLAMFLPFLTFFLFAGLASDRFDRRRIVSVTAALDGVTVLSIGMFLIYGGSSVWPVFGLLFLTATAQAFMNPAMQAIVPNLVPREQLASAIATQTTVTKSAQLGGPALGGLLLASIDTQIYFVIAALFAVATVTESSIRTPLKVLGREPFGLHVIMGGFSHIWRCRPVLGAVTIDLVAVLFGGIMGLLPVFAQDILHVGPEALGIMRAAPAVGALCVAVALARMGLPWRVGTAFFVSLVIFAGAIVVFCLSEDFSLSLAALAVYGAADMVSVYVRQTLIQIETPDHLRGRVSAVNSVAVNASNQLGDFRGGIMAAAIGTQPAVLVGAGVVLAVTALWHRTFPSLRRLESF